MGSLATGLHNEHSQKPSKHVIDIGIRKNELCNNNYLHKKNILQKYDVLR